MIPWWWLLIEAALGLLFAFIITLWSWLHWLNNKGYYDIEELHNGNQEKLEDELMHPEDRDD